MRFDVNVHEIVPRSCAFTHEPRFVLSVQGCSIRCPGCVVPQTHSADPQRLLSVVDLAQQILDAQVAGVVYIGGEPFDQPLALAELTSLVRARQPHFTIICYSGFYLAHLRQQPAAQPLLAQVDLLIDGPFDVHQAIPDRLRGSANQTLHFLTDSISPQDLLGPDDDSVELVWRKGHLIVQGPINPAQLRQLTGQMERYGLRLVPRQ